MIVIKLVMVLKLRIEDGRDERRRGPATNPDLVFKKMM